MPMQTSVSQRPLTAQKRLRSTSANSNQRIVQQQASAMPAQRRHPAAQPGIPLFRSTGDKQLLQQQTVTGALWTSRSEQASISQRDLLQPCREPVSRCDTAQQQCCTAMPQDLLRAAEQVGASQAAAAQRGLSRGNREGAAVLGNTEQQLVMPQAAYDRWSSAQLASAVMYVKPPWAIDDPFQV